VGERERGLVKDIDLVRRTRERYSLKDERGKLSMLEAKKGRKLAFKEGRQ